ncbi:MAG TPA: hypothetical protein DEO88_10935 [Syntrophobacteraceae bacterium]|nr:hypothetical protein [Syntrophobacteraceae bacterium]
MTDLLGYTSDDLMGMTADAVDGEQGLPDLGHYARLWSDQGFIRMFRQCMLDQGIRARLVAFPDGERRLTNILHLAEILHQETVDRQLGMVELLRWLVEQRNPDTRTAAEQQLRLESDDDAVQLVTIHKSKGLQYPVVFCPFLWESSNDSRKDQALLFHDATDAGRLTLDLGAASAERQAHEALAARETLAENVRLLYVALTRAQKHCTMVWGCFNQADTAALAYLFHHRGSSTSLQLVDETSGSFQPLGDAAVWEQLHDIEARASGSITLRQLPSAPAPRTSLPETADESLSARSFQGSIERHWRVSSFSAITSRKPPSGEWPDRDETVGTVRPTDDILDVEGEKEAVADILRFPQGARPGTLLHDILEHLEFTSPDRDPRATATLVSGKLSDYGFEPHWRDTLCNMLTRLVRVPLAGAGTTFTLAQIPMADRLNELEFFLPLERLNPDRLHQAFASCPGTPPRSWAAWLERLGMLDFTPVHGFLRGFIDLVFSYQNRFYLVDWKSNHLGHRLDDYSPNALAETMVREYYLLQYHLYVVALDRYLAARLPGYCYEDHFGGVHYIFLRGLPPDSGPPCGVFHDRPAKTLIASLASTLLGKEVPEPLFP